MQKWETCAITGIAKSGVQLAPFYPCLWQFSPDGFETTHLRGNESDTVAKAIAQLGLEGWELVGVGQTDIKHHVLYFKRALPDD